MPRNRRYLALTLGMIFAASVASAQFSAGGDLPPEAQKGFEASIVRHQDMKQIADVGELRKRYGEEELTEFINSSMAKLTLYPDGSFAAYAKPGGEFVSFKLGSKEFAISGKAGQDASWQTVEGAFDVPRRSRKIALKLRTRGTDFPIDCVTQYQPDEEPVTFWVGNLRGTKCLGFAGTEVPIADAAVDTAPSRAAQKGMGPE